MLVCYTIQNMSAIFESSALPRYAQLADLFRARVAKAVWAHGSLLPSIDALMLEFDVSRVTVRQAVDILAREGLLSPQRGRGTLVTGKVPEQKRLKLQTSLKEFIGLEEGIPPKVIPLSETNRLPRLLKGEGTLALEYVCMHRLHTRNGSPIAVLTIYLDKLIFDRDPKRFRREQVVPILACMPKLKLSHASQVLTVSTADLATAQHLGIALNAPVADVRRLFRDDQGRVIYLAEIVNRGDAIRVEMNLLPHS